MTSFETGPAFAQKMDAQDVLAPFRKKFHFPKTENGADCIYLCGNSLGLQPVTAEAAVLQELSDWKIHAVEGHFHGKTPWKDYHEFLTPQTARLVGAKPSEVVVMNNLTVNLHLMMVSFYRPTRERFKIMVEGGAFPSDLYAVRSQILFHGFDPDAALIELRPRTGEDTLCAEDISAAIQKEGAALALVLIGGVNYYTGQLFDMKAITQAGHAVGAVVGFDLAHAAGNVTLALHDWGVDFACWCSYKYLNSGPGGVAGCFVHERHGRAFDLPRFCGWWGHDKKDRFRMGPVFRPMEGAEGWQVSNPSIFSMAAVKAGLDIFDEAGMTPLRAKSLLLTGYLAFLLRSMGGSVRIITPENPEARGCQLSLRLAQNGRRVFEALAARGIICDWREPDCIRAAPVPLYNSFDDVYRFSEALKEEVARG